MKKDNEVKKSGLTDLELFVRRFGDILTYLIGLKRKDYYLLPKLDGKGYEVRPRNSSVKFTPLQNTQINTVTEWFNDKFKTIKI